MHMQYKIYICAVHALLCRMMSDDDDGELIEAKPEYRYVCVIVLC